MPGKTLVVCSLSLLSTATFLAFIIWMRGVGTPLTFCTLWGPSMEMLQYGGNSCTKNALLFPLETKQIVLFLKNFIECILIISTLSNSSHILPISLYLLQVLNDRDCKPRLLYPTKLSVMVDQKEVSIIWTDLKISYPPITTVKCDTRSNISN